MTINPQKHFKKRSQSILSNKRLNFYISFFTSLKNQYKSKAYGILFIISLASVSGFALFLKRITLSDHRIQVILGKISEIIVIRQSEYLFFIGTLIISLMLLRERKWISANITLSAGCVWVAFHDSTTTWLYALGIDSFSEAHDFDWDEALFFIKTMQNILHPNLTFKHLVLFAIYVASGIFIFWLLTFIRKRYGFSKERFPYITFFVGFVFITTSLNLVFKTTIQKFNDSVNMFNSTAANYQNQPPTLNFSNKGIKVVVYIGESTSIMNMGLYGYPRQTTPHLDNLSRNDDNFLWFKNVFSTHTHTSQSLLEALSVSANNDKEVRTIYSQKRISLIDILNKGKIGAFLYSNQGKSGTWNLASSIIFKKAYKKFSINSTYAGSADNLMEKPNDDAFFEQNLEPNLQSLPPHESAVVFLHSYAGHGHYLDNIPESFRHPVDSYTSSQPSSAILGANIELTEGIDPYDSAIKYVDFSVSKTIEQIKKLKQPVVFLYFSDHGDSAYTGRAHDSSRFIHEMARVPFIMYFNDTARATYPGLFEKYEALSKTGNLSTLAQVPPTVIDLLGGYAKNSAINLPNIVGASDDEGIQPIVVRETARGLTYINLNGVSSEEDNKKFINANDSATDIFIVSTHNKNKHTKICYDNANTMGKALRGTLVTDCLGLDIANLHHKAHPEDEHPGTGIENILAIAKKNNLALWIGSKSLNSPNHCTELAGFFAESNLTNKNVLVDFPEDADLKSSDWLACANSINQLGFRISYKVPTGKLMACAQALKSGLNNDLSCNSLKNDLKDAEDSKLFTDFSFDYEGINAMENISLARNLSWNTSNVEAKMFNHIKPERFRMIAVNNNDPNGLF
jgi:glucan phosphoethanolaminetransferase (alkaline phosphatase superfamily)